jgi:hypothetical protein
MGVEASSGNRPPRASTTLAPDRPASQPHPPVRLRARISHPGRRERLSWVRSSVSIVLAAGDTRTAPLPHPNPADYPSRASLRVTALVRPPWLMNSSQSLRTPRNPPNCCESALVHAHALDVGAGDGVGERRWRTFAPSSRTLCSMMVLIPLASGPNTCATNASSAQQLTCHRRPADRTPLPKPARWARCESPVCNYTTTHGCESEVQGWAGQPSQPPQDSPLPRLLPSRVSVSPQGRRQE